MRNKGECPAEQALGTDCVSHCVPGSVESSGEQDPQDLQGPCLHGVSTQVRVDK